MLLDALRRFSELGSLGAHQRRLRAELPISEMENVRDHERHDVSSRKKLQMIRCGTEPFRGLLVVSPL